MLRIHIDDCDKKENECNNGYAQTKHIETSKGEPEAILAAQFLPPMAEFLKSFQEPRVYVKDHLVSFALRTETYYTAEYLKRQK